VLKGENREQKRRETRRRYIHRHLRRKNFKHEKAIW